MIQMSLVNYGIQTEKSHIRVHVCPIARCVYVYPTISGLKAISTGKYPLIYAYQTGHENPTARGYLVPPDNIACCIEIVLNNNTWEFFDFREEESVINKGEKAVRLVKGMIKKGLLPFPAIPKIIKNQSMQINGIDILIQSTKQNNVHIQVKCDFKGGDKNRGGTGNLFLQIQEANPKKQY